MKKQNLFTLMAFLALTGATAFASNGTPLIEVQDNAQPAQPPAKKEKSLDLSIRNLDYYNILIATGNVIQYDTADIDLSINIEDSVIVDMQVISSDLQTSGSHAGHTQLSLGAGIPIYNVKDQALVGVVAQIGGESVGHDDFRFAVGAKLVLFTKDADAGWSVRYLFGSNELVTSLNARMVASRNVLVKGDDIEGTFRTMFTTSDNPGAELFNGNTEIAAQYRIGSDRASLHFGPTVNLIDGKAHVGFRIGFMWAGN